MNASNKTQNAQTESDSEVLTEEDWEELCTEDHPLNFSDRMNHIPIEMKMSCLDNDTP